MKKLSASSVRDWRTEKKKSATKKRKIDYSDIPPLSDRQLASLRRVGRPRLFSPFGPGRFSGCALLARWRIRRWYLQTEIREQEPTTYGWLGR